jgi:hypothetical protein
MNGDVSTVSCANLSSLYPDLSPLFKTFCFPFAGLSSVFTVQNELWMSTIMTIMMQMKVTI